MVPQSRPVSRWTARSRSVSLTCGKNEWLPRAASVAAKRSTRRKDSWRKPSEVMSEVEKGTTVRSPETGVAKPSCVTSEARSSTLPLFATFAPPAVGDEILCRPREYLLCILGERV